MHEEEQKFLKDKKLSALEIDFDTRHAQGYLTLSRIQFARKRDEILKFVAKSRQRDLKVTQQMKSDFQRKFSTWQESCRAFEL